MSFCLSGLSAVSDVRCIIRSTVYLINASTNDGRCFIDINIFGAEDHDRAHSYDLKEAVGNPIFYGICGSAKSGGESGDLVRYGTRPRDQTISSLR